ncbi:hypothetical protein E2C01_079665 [Portunus trituberculatus]|uniref:Uncharacterized protein n=1 Tax=Portunus trituberculatus TaxID=210409 RepID=A0A5B7IR73_PORTR|nr:hypothetical protein [Portunus trituberculatus]
MDARKEKQQTPTRDPILDNRETSREKKFVPDKLVLGRLYKYPR